MANNEHDKCGTDECCMQCDTADNPKDWYLIAINPWYRIYYNPVTDKHRQIPYKEVK